MRWTTKEHCPGYEILVILATAASFFGNIMPRQAFLLERAANCGVKETIIRFFTSCEEPEETFQTM